MKAYFARAALLLVLVLSSSASAQAADDGETGSGTTEEAAADAAPAEGRDSGASNDSVENQSPEGSEPSYGHKRQLGLRVGLVAGYRMVLRYDESPLCRDYESTKGNDQQKFCGYAAPLALNFAVSAALLDSLEPFAWARIGLGGEKHTNTAPLLAFGLGARIYTMSDSALKIFVEPALGLELERKGDSSDPTRVAIAAKYYRTDLLFHLAAGPHFDLSENFGLYADAGLTLGILRYLHSTLELSAGIQGRLP